MCLGMLFWLALVVLQVSTATTFTSNTVICAEQNRGGHAEVDFHVDCSQENVRINWTAPMSDEFFIFYNCSDSPNKFEQLLLSEISRIDNGRSGIAEVQVNYTGFCTYGGCISNLDPNFFIFIRKNFTSVTCARNASSDQYFSGDLNSPTMTVAATVTASEGNLVDSTSHLSLMEYSSTVLTSSVASPLLSSSTKSLSSSSVRSAIEMSSTVLTPFVASPLLSSSTKSLSSSSVQSAIEMSSTVLTSPVASPLLSSSTKSLSSTSVQSSIEMSSVAPSSTSSTLNKSSNSFNRLFIFGLLSLHFHSVCCAGGGGSYLLH